MGKDKRSGTLGHKSDKNMKNIPTFHNFIVNHQQRIIRKDHSA